MKSRLIASVALGAAVILGATGCGLVSTQGTTIPYSPADGINVPASSGPLEIRNALVVTNAAGDAGNLVAAIVNSTSETETLTVRAGEGSGQVSKTVRVPANGVVSLGSDEHDPLLLAPLETSAGATLPIFFQSGNGTGTITDVPVLDGQLAYLADFVPETRAATPTPTPTP